MTTTLSELAFMVGGRLIGDASLSIFGANPPGETTAGDITLLDDARHLTGFDPGEAWAVVSPTEVPGAIAQIIVDDPHRAFSKIVAHFRPPIVTYVPAMGISQDANIDPTAVIHPSATIASGVTIGPGVKIMPGVVVMPHCQIGEDCVIHSGVTLYEYTRLDDRVVIHAGSVIGAYGFGYRQHEGRHVLTAQLGYVHIESDVELGAAVTVDRGTYGPTRIGEGTKVDNQVMIAHNCKIGKHNLICSQVGIAGSCSTGDYVVMAGQVGLKDHIHLGDQTVVGAQAGVMENCDGHQVLPGSPATAQREQMQIMATERKLPEMRRELKSLRKEVTTLRELLAEQSGGQPSGQTKGQKAA